MKLSLSHLVPLSLLVATPALSQSYAAQIAALQPLSAQASFGTQSSTQTAPAGPLTATGMLVAAAFGSSARLQWTAAATDTSTSVTLNSNLISLSTGGNSGAATLGSNELLVEFQPTGAPSATLEIVTTWYGSSGPAPSVQIDLANDGFFDLTNPSSTISLALPAGQLYQVRVVLGSTVSASTPTGTSLATNFGTVSLTVRPSNNLYVAQTVGQCMNYGPSLTLADAFTDQGLAIETFAPTQPSVLVIGFTPLVALLPIAASPLPCILLPQPDLVMALPFQQSMTIPLPPAVRPATFYVQGVALSSQADLLGVSAGYTVIAQ